MTSVQERWVCLGDECSGKVGVLGDEWSGKVGVLGDDWSWYEEDANYRGMK